EDGIRDDLVTGVQTCALPISGTRCRPSTCTLANCASGVARVETTTSDPAPRFATVDVNRSRSRSPTACTSSDDGGSSTRFGSGSRATGAATSAIVASAASLVTAPTLVPRLSRVEPHDRALALVDQFDVELSELLPP